MLWFIIAGVLGVMVSAVLVYRCANDGNVTDYIKYADALEELKRKPRKTKQDYVEMEMNRDRCAECTRKWHKDVLPAAILLVVSALCILLPLYYYFSLK